jgi:hypothetical protein
MESVRYDSAMQKSKINHSTGPEHNSGEAVAGLRRGFEPKKFN